MRSVFRNAVAWAAVAALALSALSVSAQDYPSKPLRLIVPFAPGGGVDIYSRLLAAAMSAQLGQQVLVENQPGAGGISALERVAKSPKDGYTLIAVSSTNISTSPHLFRNLPYKMDEFAPVAAIVRFPFYMYIHPAVPAKNWAEFYAYAKANPGKLNYATTGRGSTPHLCGELIEAAAGIDMLDVPYKGSGPALADLLGGQVHAYFDVASPGLSYALNGKLRALLVMDNKRDPRAPEVPAVTELGYKDALAFNRYSLLVATGTPRAIIDRLNRAAIASMESGPLRERQNADFGYPGPVTPDELALMLKQDFELWGTTIRRLGLHLD